MISSDNNRIMEVFIETVKNNNGIYLLQAYDGMFAMIEDNTGQEFLPVWTNSELASGYIQDDWQEYRVEQMPLNEFIGWMNELQTDEIMIAIYMVDSNIITSPPQVIKKMLTT